MLQVTKKAVCLYQTLMYYPRGVMFVEHKIQKQMKGARVSVNMCVTDGVVGREVTAAREQPVMISIKLDDALTHSIGSDVKHDKSVPGTISAHSSDNYQRASSVSTQNNPLQTHTNR